MVNFENETVDSKSYHKTFITILKSRIKSVYLDLKYMKLQKSIRKHLKRLIVPSKSI